MSDADHEPDPLIACLRERAATKPDEIVLIGGARRWSAAALLRDSERLAAGLVAEGVRPGDRVALHLYNVAEAALAYLACFQVGAIAMPLNARFKGEELRHWIERTTPKVYIGQAALFDGISAVPEDGLPSAARFVVDLDGSKSDARLWSTLLREAPSHFDLPEPDPDAPAVLLATSGTTGPSKLVVWTLRMLAAFGPSARGRGIGQGDILPLVTPMMHGSGVYYLTSALTQGATAVLIPRFEPDAMLDIIERHRCTSLFGLPFMCAQLVQQQKQKPRDVASLRVCSVAGDTCPPELEQAFEGTFGQPLLSFWAAAEDVGAAMLGSRVGPLTRLVPEAEVQIVDDDGTPVAADDTGEMLVKSPTTTPGYWEGPDRITPLPNGFFHSGDLVRWEGDRELRYMGRKKDLIIRGGSNISPAEVEALLMSQPDVREAAVVGIPDRDYGQRVGALLVLKGQKDATSIPSVLRAIQPKIADYKLPEVVALADEIPRNALTKIDRKAVLELVQSKDAFRPTG